MEVEAEWGLLNDKEKDSKIGDTLKKLGSVKKKKTSPNIPKDMLGVGGDLALVKVKANHDKLLTKEKRKLDLLYLSVNYLEHKIKKCRHMVDNCIEHSKSRTYKKEVLVKG